MSRVLSIQSHMVSGYCGNKAATFPLQLLGFDVDVMNTVNFSNHTGYPSWTGERATANQLKVLLEGLQTNGLDEYSHILTGYIGSPDNLSAVATMVEQFQQKSGAFYVLDPVMGDNGQLYVQQEVIPIYRSMLRFANAVTPNQFEAEILTDKKITDWVSCLAVLNDLHTSGVANVVLTSVALSAEQIQANCAVACLSSPSSSSSSPPSPSPSPSPSSSASSSSSPLLSAPLTEGDMYCVCSSRGIDGITRVFAIGFPTLDGYFTGTGDLFSALLLARLEQEKHAEQEQEQHQQQQHGRHKETTPLARACIQVVATMKAVVQRTFAAQQGLVGRSTDRSQKADASVVKRCELKLIQSKKEIEQPDIRASVVREMEWKV